MWNLTYQANGIVLPLGTKKYSKIREPQAQKKKNKARQRLSKLSREAALIGFDLGSISKADRLAFLLKHAKDGATIPADLLACRRKDFEKRKYHLLQISGMNCYCCDTESRHRHHVVPLGRGGSNSRANLVRLCNKCHEAVHPSVVFRPEATNEILDTEAGILPADTPTILRKTPKLGVNGSKPLSSFSAVVAVAAS